MIRTLATAVAIAVCIIATATDASAAAVHSLPDDEAAANGQVATASDTNSRLLRRRVKQQAHTKARNRQLQDVVIEGEARGSICKRIIATSGSTRLPDTAPVESETVARRTHGITWTGSFEGSNIDSDGSFHSAYAEEGDEFETDEDFVCELDDGMTVPIQGSNAQISELRSLLNTGQLISAESTVEIDFIGSGESDGTVGIGADTIPNEIASLPPGSIKLISNGQRNRRLNNKTTGAKKALVVRVTDRDGKAPDGNARYLSDKFFGTYGDKVTMVSGFKDCTFGKLTLTNEYGDSGISSKLAAPGVLDVTLTIALKSSTKTQVRNAVVTAAQNKLGLRFPNIFDHVLFVIEDCYQVQDSCTWAAYAFVNHWFSIYHSDNYKYPAVQMHEVGHNLNLAHSGGLDGRTYTDHTCLMGNPLFEDDKGAMCFNPVKNFQIAKSGSWYDEKHIKAFNSKSRQRWRGRLIGAAEYDKITSNDGIVMKLETGNDADFFVGLNRAVGPNADTMEAADKVTIYKVEKGDGLGYSHSFLKASLKKGQRARISDWRQTGTDLFVKVHEINTRVQPGYADVEISFGEVSVTPNPTKLPTKFPTHSPTFKPTAIPTASPSHGPTEYPTNSPTQAPTTHWPTSSPIKITSSPTHATSSAPSSSPTITPEQSSPVPLDSTTTIDFDDVTSNSYAPIGNSYHGFSWNNFHVLHRDQYATSGYQYGITSGNYVAFYTGHTSSSLSGSISSSEPFSVAGFQATAAWQNGVHVLVESFDDSGNRIDSHETTLGDPHSGPTFIDLRKGDFRGLHELKITTSGGTSVVLGGGGPHLAIDDLHVYDVN